MDCNGYITTNKQENEDIYRGEREKKDAYNTYYYDKNNEIEETDLELGSEQKDEVEYGCRNDKRKKKVSKESFLGWEVKTRAQKEKLRRRDHSRKIATIKNII